MKNRIITEAVRPEPFQFSFCHPESLSFCHSEGVKRPKNLELIERSKILHSVQNDNSVAVHPEPVERNGGKSSFPAALSPFSVTLSEAKSLRPSGKFRTLRLLYPLRIREVGHKTPVAMNNPGSDLNETAFEYINGARYA
jgi:hypothetical protein